MCLAVPARVVELREGSVALVDWGGVRKEVSLALLEGVVVGDYVIVHAGFGLSRLDEQAAARTLELLEELSATQAAEAPPRAGHGVGE